MTMVRIKSRMGFWHFGRSSAIEERRKTGAAARQAARQARQTMEDHKKTIVLARISGISLSSNKES